jgi:hypothetical protein
MTKPKVLPQITMSNLTKPKPASKIKNVHLTHNIELFEKLYKEPKAT